MSVWGVGAPRSRRLEHGPRGELAARPRIVVGRWGPRRSGAVRAARIEEESGALRVRSLRPMPSRCLDPPQDCGKTRRVRSEPPRGHRCPSAGLRSAAASIRPPAPVTAGGACIAIAPTSDVSRHRAGTATIRLQTGWQLAIRALSFQRGHEPIDPLDQGPRAAPPFEGHCVRSETPCIVQRGYESKLVAVPRETSSPTSPGAPHPFAVVPPALASAKRGFALASDRDPVCLAARRDRGARGASLPLHATQPSPSEHPRLVGSRPRRRADLSAYA